MKLLVYKSKKTRAKEQADARDAKIRETVEVFLAAYKELSLKYGFDFAAQLRVDQAGIAPVIVIIPVKAEK